ncbi:MAG: arsinothricin resistance N-acetyltransferase ArsN1 family B [Bacteroidota bacterium]
MIRSATPDDAAAIAEIYNYYIENSVATFEEIKVTIADMGTRIQKVTSKLPWIVYEKDGLILGYAYATQWKPRSAYRKSVESTVYVAPNAYQKGIGRKLYVELIDQLKVLTLHAVLAGITLPNEASIALHEHLGFVKVGQFKEVGFKFQKWVDVGYWQLILNY